MCYLSTYIFILQILQNSLTRLVLPPHLPCFVLATLPKSLLIISNFLTSRKVAHIYLKKVYIRSGKVAIVVIEEASYVSLCEESLTLSSISFRIFRYVIPDISDFQLCFCICSISVCMRVHLPCILFLLNYIVCVCVCVCRAERVSVILLFIYSTS